MHFGKSKKTVAKVVMQNSMSNSLTAFVVQQTKFCSVLRNCSRVRGVNFVTVHHQFVFVILSLPKTLHYNGSRHLNMIEMSLGKIRRPRLFTETQMAPTLSNSINVSDFIKQIGNGLDFGFS